MHYAFALVAAFLATSVVASPALQERGYGYERKIVTVTKTRPAYYNAWNSPRKTKHYKWHKSHGKHRGYYKKPSFTEEDPAEEDPAEEDPTEEDPTDDEEDPHSKKYPTYGDDKPSKKEPSKKEPAKELRKKEPVEEKPDEGSSSGGSLEAECLKAHNDKRAIHGAAPLKWSSEMASHAMQVCQTCVFEHSNSKYGENLAAGYQSAASAIQAWYDENDQYDYRSGDFSSGTGHFTQMVWKNAKSVGCALYECNGSGGVPGKFLTCNYDTGNVIGQFQDNVLAPSK